MKYGLLTTALFLSFFSNPATAKITVTDDSSKGESGTAANYGKFNYTYIRFATFLPADGFNNPIASTFPGSENFSIKTEVHNSYKLGFESGKVRHFKNLHLGTEMLKLGINSGLAVQAFGSGSQETSNITIKTDGTYLLRLGLGPQLTFKPVEDFRLGIFYRAGIAFAYSGYNYQEMTTIDAATIRTDKTDIHLLNYAYNGELGIDLSWRAICIGFTYGMMQVLPSKGAIVDAQSRSKDYNTYSSTTQGTTTTSTSAIIDPKLNFNRIGFSLGFAF